MIMTRIIQSKKKIKKYFKKILVKPLTDTQHKFYFTFSRRYDIMSCILELC